MFSCFTGSMAKPSRFFSVGKKSLSIILTFSLSFTFTFTLSLRFFRFLRFFAFIFSTELTEHFNSSAICLLVNPCPFSSLTLYSSTVLGLPPFLPFSTAVAYLSLALSIPKPACTINTLIIGFVFSYSPYMPYSIMAFIKSLANSLSVSSSVSITSRLVA